MAHPTEQSVAPDFADRIARIEAQHQSIQRRRVARAQGTPGYALSLLAAVGVGYMILLMARYARFHLTGLLPGETGVDISALGVEMAMAMMASVILGWLFQFNSAEHSAARGCGMVVALFTTHMWVHAFPAMFSVVFSEAWVNRVILLTDAGTLAIF